MMIDEKKFIEVLCFMNNNFFTTHQDIYKMAYTKMWCCIDKELQKKIHSEPIPFQINYDFVMKCLNGYDTIKFFKELDLATMEFKKELPAPKPKWWEIWKR